MGRGRDVRALVPVALMEGVFVEGGEMGFDAVERGGSVADFSLDTDIPVKAVQISSTGGAGSLHGTVKSGLSQRL